MKLMVKRESTLYTAGGDWEHHVGGGTESLLKHWKGKSSKWGPYPGPESYVYEAVASWLVYHFYDTSTTAGMRRDHSIRNWRELQPDAANIAPFLLRLKTKHLE
jgi:predicted ATPase